MNFIRSPQQADELGIIATGQATGIVDLGDHLSPIQVIGTQAIRESMGASYQSYSKRPPPTSGGFEPACGSFVRGLRLGTRLGH